VFLRYCDGTLFQGTRSKPISFRNKKLYFRGSNITKAILKSLNDTYGLWNEAEMIVVHGASSGATAAVLWCNYISDNARGDVRCIADSYFLYDTMTLDTNRSYSRNEHRNFMAISNA
jgi:hypothetical protein